MMIQEAYNLVSGTTNAATTSWLDYIAANNPWSFVDAASTMDVRGGGELRNNIVWETLRPGTSLGHISSRGFVAYTDGDGDAVVGRPQKYKPLKPFKAKHPEVQIDEDAWSALVSPKQ